MLADILQDLSSLPDDIAADSADDATNEDAITLDLLRSYDTDADQEYDTVVDTSSSSVALSPLVSTLRKSIRQQLYPSDPVAWIEDILGEQLWSKQRDICASIVNNRRTAVKSCHSSGKSFCIARIVEWWLNIHEPGEAFVVTSAPTAAQVRAILWREINRAHAKGKLRGRTNQTEIWYQGADGNEEMVAFGRKPAEYDPSAFQGIHAKYVLVAFDEAGGIPTPLWNSADSLVSNEYSRFVAIGNPDDIQTEFAEVCKPGSGWNVITISAFDTPNFKGEAVSPLVRDSLISPIWVEEKRKKWGEDNPLYISKILGQFPEHNTDGLIPMSWIKAAQERDLAPSQPIELGVDVGGGANRNVIALRCGPVVRIIKRDQNPDTMQTLSNVLDAIKRTSATLAKVDNIGIGHGAVDRAKEMAADQQIKMETPELAERANRVRGVNVGGMAKDKEAYVNLKAEKCWYLRERFREGNIDIDPADDDLAAQLAGMKYKRSGGRIQIESKDEMRRRGMPSPDEFDSVVLAYADVEPEVVQIRGVIGKSRRGG